MSTFITYDENYSFVAAMLTIAIKDRVVVSGSTKKAEEIAEAASQAKQNMVSQALAAYGNDKRVEKVRPILELVPESLQETRHWNWVPSLTASDFYAWVRDVRKRWDNGTWGGKSDTEWAQEVVAEFYEVVWGGHFAAHLVDIRKALVKGGVIEPDESDKDWIREEYEVFVKGNEPIAQLAAKAGVTD